MFGRHPAVVVPALHGCSLRGGDPTSTIEKEHPMIDLIGGLLACVLLFGFVVGPLAWISGTWDSPTDEATKHYPRARTHPGHPRPRR